jgi:Fuc2NAc and GlcNAc transferase
LILGIGVCLLSLVLTGVVRVYALRHKLLDHPNARSSHTAPTPRGGGLAIVAASEVGIAAATSSGLITSRDGITLGLGMLIIAAVGWLDDTRGLKPSMRLPAHFLAAGWALWMFHGLPALRIGDTSLALGAVGYFVGAIGIVWAVNLFNFMDGIDGFAGSQAVLILGVGSCLFFFRGDRSLGLISLMLTGSTAGFLAWNWPPAKIFMGDVGSGVIGYAVSVLAIGSENRHAVPLLAFAILGSLFIADATVTLIRRVTRGNSPAQAHRDHAYQRLTVAWGSHRRVTVSAIALTGVVASLAVAATASARFLVPALILAAVLMASLLIATERRSPM